MSDGGYGISYSSSGGDSSWMLRTPTSTTSTSELPIKASTTSEEELSNSSEDVLQQLEPGIVLELKSMPDGRKVSVIKLANLKDDSTSDDYDDHAEESQSQSFNGSLRTTPFSFAHSLALSRSISETHNFGYLHLPKDGPPKFHPNVKTFRSPRSFYETGTLDQASDEDIEHAPISLKAGEKIAEEYSAASSIGDVSAGAQMGATSSSMPSENLLASPSIPRKKRSLTRAVGKSIAKFFSLKKGASTRHDGGARVILMPLRASQCPLDWLSADVLSLIFHLCFLNGERDPIALACTSLRHATLFKAPELRHLRFECIRRAKREKRSLRYSNKTRANLVAKAHTSPVGSRIRLSLKSPAASVEEELPALRTTPQNQLALLILGSGALIETIMKHFVLSYAGGFSREEAILFRDKIKATCVENMKDLVKQANLIEGVTTNTAAQSSVMLMKFKAVTLEAIKGLWEDDSINRTVLRSEDSNVRYFFDRIQRILKVEYVPTGEDILRLSSSGTIQTTTFSYVGLNFLVHTDPKKVALPRLIIYVVNLELYPAGFDEELDEFEQALNQPSSRNCEVRILLVSTESFTKKLKELPFKTCFPDYTLPDVYEFCIEHLIEKFIMRNENPNRTIIHHELSTVQDVQKIKQLFATISDAFLITMEGNENSHQ